PWPLHTKFNVAPLPRRMSISRTAEIGFVQKPARTPVYATLAPLDDLRSVLEIRSTLLTPVVPSASLPHICKETSLLSRMLFEMRMAIPEAISSTSRADA